MATLESTFFDLGYIETLAQQQTAIHQLDPRAKLLTTLMFLVTVMSFRRYELSGLIPFFLYPLVIVRAGNLPSVYLVKRIGVVLPFVGLIGIFNPLFDQTIIMQLGPVAISGGWVSFLSIVLRCLLTVFAVLILIATTGFYRICTALERIGVPNMFAVQLLFVYRYLFVLIDEASRMARARALRSFSRKGFGLKTWGSLTGHLLLRTLDRAQRIHLAMLVRGFDGKIRLARHETLQIRDIVFVLGWSSLFIMLRLYNLSMLIGNMLTTM
ncbi:cobalt ABC transporter, inner membrane subunit CbiQ [Candidatus Vecturithrix granuli]|uniref:Cobalt ABC transporter, inner membrane subunit CbiQ n=1 Tax=Vecturithrix granuli TaxID=1499967 RepID=A0A081BTN0_VECG1|nr:cobalt ABC transporter, inner membrane subunit CbiQ [Candidatus Vecturithrix granuli]